MTDNCPKCGAAARCEHSVCVTYDGFAWECGAAARCEHSACVTWECDTCGVLVDGSLIQSDRCRIAELERALATAERERDMVAEVAENGWGRSIALWRSGCIMRSADGHWRCGWPIDLDKPGFPTLLEAVRAAMETAKHAIKAGVAD